MSRLDPRLLLQGYATGIFPMADSRDADDLFWVEPRNRAILPLDQFHLSRSLRRTIQRGPFSVTRDCDFAGVVEACADRPETWINAEIEQAMLALHASGHAHSIEVWSSGPQGRELAGGRRKLSQRHVGGTDASKVALAWLVAHLKAGNFTLLDCQFMTDHLASLGAVTVPRSTYVGLLAGALGGSAGTGAGAGAARRGRSAPEPVDFGALDRLLELAGADAGAAGPAGYVITQLLGQTS